METGVPTRHLTNLSPQQGELQEVFRNNMKELGTRHGKDTKEVMILIEGNLIYRVVFFRWGKQKAK